MSKHNFPALRTVATVFKILAWIVAAASVVAFVFLLVGGGGYGVGIGGNRIAMAFAVLLGGAIYTLMLFAVAEGILVLLAIEENTRKAAEK
ncbi:MAG: hypothetical protein JW747_09930 [Candidatus Aminicenantes bacterium]|nr:hypothetical protein [Candidatus Aminicenantes bacterium]